VLLLGATLTLATASPLPGQAIPKAALDAVRSRIRHLIDSAQVPSVTVAVAKDGRIVWEEGFGFADLERRTPATPTTLYSMASISKPIAATGVMKLAEQGRIDLDRPANDYLGPGKITGLAGDASGATVPASGSTSRPARIAVTWPETLEGARATAPTRSTIADHNRFRAMRTPGRGDEGRSYGTVVCALGLEISRRQ
jgi:hypothetical protein